MLLTMNIISELQFLQSEATGLLLGLEKLMTFCVCFRDVLCKPHPLSMRGFLRSCLWLLSPALTHRTTIIWFIFLHSWEPHRWTLLLFWYWMLLKHMKKILIYWKGNSKLKLLSLNSFHYLAASPWSQLQSCGSGGEAEEAGWDVSVGGAPGEQVSLSASCLSLRWFYRFQIVVDSVKCLKNFP